ncbi:MULTISPECIES: hypothetical protein [Lactobacillaceae]|uniref:hypothetical protein n=1 Tax=Lactobacillaceae TaxID=33958 RepID=UPI0014576113|nr:hypothetical protein [Lactobacillus sp. HBUAS51381]NLR09067.1 hypothetical protein [Lactobacillus sp. HBUAS51381]
MTDAADNLAFIMTVTRQLNLDKPSNWRITGNFAEINELSNLVELLLKTDTILVVENLENMPEKALSLRIRLAGMAKNLSDEAINYLDSYAKIIFTGVEETAAQLWGICSRRRGDWQP